MRPKRPLGDGRETDQRMTKEKAIEFCNNHFARLPENESVMKLYTETMSGKFLKIPSFWYAAHFDEARQALVSDYHGNPINFNSNYMYYSQNYAKMNTHDGEWWSTTTHPDQTVNIPCLSAGCFNIVNLIDLELENCTVEGKVHLEISLFKRIEFFDFAESSGPATSNSFRCMSPKKPNLPSRKVDNVPSILHPCTYLSLKSSFQFGQRAAKKFFS